MTREEAITNIKALDAVCGQKEFYDKEFEDALSMAIKALEFAEWVAEEIFSDDWEYNKDSFAEIACRKLEKVGIVKLIDGHWVLAESEEV